MNLIGNAGFCFHKVDTDAGFLLISQFKIVSEVISKWFQMCEHIFKS